MFVRMMRTSILARLDARDRALFAAWCIGPAASRRRRALWTALTHAGGATCTVFAALLPIVFASALLWDAGVRAMLTLVISHVAVQGVKRTVGRPRPARATSLEALVAEPDRFSFPSGHACAAMAVAFVYATTYPALALPLVALAWLVGVSRICLGVHYPGDVFVGQAIAIATGLVVNSV